MHHRLDLLQAAVFSPRRVVQGRFTVDSRACMVQRSLFHARGGCLDGRLDADQDLASVGGRQGLDGLAATRVQGFEKGTDVPFDLRIFSRIYFGAHFWM